MERLTYDFCIGGNHCWQVKGADNLECREVCERQGDDGCKTCPIAKAFDRLAAIEDILGDEYDLERLRVIMDAEQHGGLIVGYGPGDPGEPGELGVMEEVAADNVVVVSAESAGIAPCRQGLRRDTESPEPFPAISGHATGET